MVCWRSATAMHSSPQSCMQPLCHMRLAHRRNFLPRQITRPAAVQAAIALDKPSSPLPKCVATFSPAFCDGPATFDACCSKPWKGDWYRWGKESSAWRQRPPLRGPCLVQGWEQCACPRCQLPHTGFCRCAPGNSQIRAAGWLSSHHLIASVQPPMRLFCAAPRPF